MVRRILIELLAAEVVTKKEILARTTDAEIEWRGFDVRLQSHDLPLNGNHHSRLHLLIIVLNLLGMNEYCTKKPLPHEFAWKSPRI